MHHGRDGQTSRPRLTPRSTDTAELDAQEIEVEILDPAPRARRGPFRDDDDRDLDDLTDTQALELLAPGGTSEHGASSRRARVLEPEPSAGRSVLPTEALRALRAGLESVVISWLLITVPVIAAYVATVASPVLGEASWLDAARNGSAGWLLGLGQEMAVLGVDGSTTAVTLAPLALTLVTCALLAGSVRRARLTHPGAFAVAALAAAGVVVLAYALAEQTPSPRAVGTTAVVIGVSVLVGAARSRALPALPASDTVTAAVVGLRGGLRAVTTLVVLGAVTVVGLVLARSGAVLELQRALDADPLSLVVLVVGQLLAVPTLAVWALAWWLGPGFSIGMVDVAPSGVADGPLPVVPILAALPEAGPGPGAAVVLVPIALLTLVLAGVVRRAGADWRGQVLALVSAVVATTAVVTVLAGLSGGVDGATIGPLAAVGTRTAEVAGTTAWVTAVAAAVAWVLVLGARRLDLPGRYPVLGDLAAAGRRLRAGLAAPRVLRRFSRRR
ncbi:hypothetical protein C8046_06675 [Serinibacter arcticus]|uniref:Uncharacterized protein n=1 Tax=Serinibacter arcticus TaxID=1655435 RepID=A0A2U1ZTU1_9MICO|nr:DUF6350 family protein [Serinibacter arcticus]PWD50381.1 hypothetical protein C8046_06675 [Serinibacter arcticus]